MIRLFVTGTDTNVGKTVISAWLAHHLKASYWKPVQSGTMEGFDSETVRQYSEVQTFPETYSLKAPLSPHLAAKLEKVEIDIERFVIPVTDNTLIIEGAGGVHVPLNSRHTMLDLISKLKIPTIVVARSTLGTINHTCLTLEALRVRSIPVIGVIMNGPKNTDNKQAIEHFGKTTVFAEIEHIPELTKEALSKIIFPEGLLEALRNI